MKCPECIRLGLKSTIRMGGTTTTSMGFSDHYDEDGQFHSHDPNSRCTTFQCSHGHQGVILDSRKCPTCGYQQTPPEIRTNSCVRQYAL
jgi:hypothetical protein